jgi:hypothetical protein
MSAGNRSTLPVPWRHGCRYQAERRPGRCTGLGLTTWAWRWKTEGGVGRGVCMQEKRVCERVGGLGEQTKEWRRVEEGRDRAVKCCEGKRW